jgi:hypothetical protein
MVKYITSLSQNDPSEAGTAHQRPFLQNAAFDVPCQESKMIKKENK